MDRPAGTTSRMVTVIGSLAIMLLKLLTREGFQAETMSPATSVVAKVAELGKRNVDMVVISGLSPGALIPARS
jgi:hypothetical protein